MLSAGRDTRRRGSVNQIGSGTTTLSGNSTYTGPTNINAGTLAVISTFGSTPMGTGVVNMNGGKLSLAGGYGAVQQTVGLSGWNQDIIAEKTAAIRSSARRPMC